jgi:hypothetical protein
MGQKGREFSTDIAEHVGQMQYTSIYVQSCCWYYDIRTVSMHIPSPA